MILETRLPGTLKFLRQDNPHFHHQLPQFDVKGYYYELAVDQLRIVELSANAPPGPGRQPHVPQYHHTMGLVELPDSTK